MFLHPLVIRQFMGDDDEFTGVHPKDQPTKALEHSIHTYSDENAGGEFKFSDDAFMVVRRVVADFKTATDWSIKHRRPQFPGEPESLVTDLAAEGANEVDLKLDIDLLPGESIVVYTTASGGNAYAEVYATTRIDPTS